MDTSLEPSLEQVRTIAASGDYRRIPVKRELMVDLSQSSRPSGRSPPRAATALHARERGAPTIRTLLIPRLRPHSRYRARTAT